MLERLRSGEEAPDDGDTSIVTAATRGDAAAFRELYERHTRAIYNMVLRSVREPRAAEDACQEIWMKVHRVLPKLREPSAFRPWLYRIAAKTCIDASRRRARRPAAQALTDELVDRRRGPEAVVVEREGTRLAWEALAALPANQHLALFLKEVEGRSYREIADVLNISETAVGLCLMRARRSFVRAYERLKDAAAAERCEQTRGAMAALVDGEADAVQQLSVRAHVAGCRACERELAVMRRASQRYGALAMLPVPALLSARVLAQGVGTAGAAGGGAGLAKLLALLATHARPLTLAVTAGGGLTAAALLTSPPEPATSIGGTTATAPAHARVAPQPGGGSGARALPADAPATPTPTSTATAGLALPTDVVLPLLTPYASSLLAPTLVPATRITAPLDPVATAIAPITDPVATAGAPVVDPLQTAVAALPTPPPLLLP